MPSRSWHSPAVPAVPNPPDIDGLIIRDLGPDDVDRWAQTELERRHLVGALAESDRYLAAVLPIGRIVGKIGIRYNEHPDAGNLYQFDVLGGYRRRGIGSKLLTRAQEIIAEHGCRRSTLGVEETNQDAIRLYHRFGYREFGTETAEWDQQAPDGSIYRYRCICVLMERQLSRPAEA